MSQIFRNYTWDAGWVRPYESPFSILVNFARVNVLSSKRALMLMQYSPAEYKKLINKMVSDTVFSETHLFQEFFPSDYCFFHFTPFDSKLQSSHQLYDEVHFCPRCLYDSGYHSVVHQIKGVKKCPLHDIPLRIIHSPYYTFPSLTDSIRMKDTNDTNSTYINVHRIPLPPERMELDLTGISNLDYLNPGHRIFDVIGPTNKKTTECFEAYSLTDFRDLTEVRCFSVSFLEKGMEEFDKDFIQGFKHTYVGSAESIGSNYGLHESVDDYLNTLMKRMRVFYHHNFSNNCPLAIEQACVMNLMATCNRSFILSLGKLNKIIDSFSQLKDVITIDMLKTIFCYIMVGCQFPKDIINPGYYHYSYQRDITMPRTNIDLSISHLWYMDIASDNDRTYIQYVVQCDKFNYLWKEFYKIVEEEKLQDFSSITAKLPLVRYIVTKDTNDMIHIYRQIVMRK